MSRIKILSEALANQIAAGEVVERPASVVKELVENSLDAEARSISVLIEKSGKDRIRVADDGIGMSAEDARLAFARHATSKLIDASDLSRITTLGFRGEALPSIASVSHFTLQTRDDSSSSGIELVMEGGKLVRQDELGLPRGTIIDVRRLFFNVPARRKFLRSEVTEASHIAQLLCNLATAFPEVHFRLEHGKRTVLDTPPVRDGKDRLFQIEGSWIEGAIPVAESVGNLIIKGWLSPPAEDRGAGQRLRLFVNNRPVKDRTLTHAVMEAYRQVSSKPGTPRAYIFIELPTDKIDVNVHPAKTEVRFVDQRFVHHAVFSVLKNTLGAQGRAPDLVVQAGVVGEPSVSFGDASPMGRTGFSGGFFKGAADGVEGRGLAIAEALFREPAQVETPEFTEFADAPPALLGQFRDSFIVAADEEGVWLVNQHAAHERVLYEELLERQTDERPPQQILLTPLHLELTPAERVTMEEEISKFASFGFDIESFGSGSFLIRAVPAVIKIWIR